MTDASLHTSNFLVFAVLLGTSGQYLDWTATTLYRHCDNAATTVAAKSPLKSTIYGGFTEGVYEKVKRCALTPITLHKKCDNSQFHQQ